MEDALLETEFAGASTQVEEPLEEVRRVLVAIPAYNEWVAIGSVVLKASQYVDEVIVVDDGSTDDTAEIADLAGATVLRHARNLGKGMAIRSAWLYAREKRAGALVLLDGDHQHEPRDIPRLVGPIMTGEADVMLGVRWGRTSGMPLYRRAGKRLLDYVTALGTKQGLLTDSQCGYRAFSAHALATLEPDDAGLGIESQMLIEAQDVGLRIQEVDIRARYDVEGSTLSPGRHGMGVLGHVLSLVSERRPLFFFGVPGAALLLGAALFGLLVVTTFSLTGQLAIGTAFLVLLLGIVGVLSIFIGIVLHAIRKLVRN